MLDIQIKQIAQWSQMLDKWGVPHKIMLPEGKEFGALEVVTKKPSLAHQDCTLLER
mgnify:CR=1 FL=1